MSPVHLMEAVWEAEFVRSIKIDCCTGVEVRKLRWDAWLRRSLALPSVYGAQAAGQW